MRNLIIFLILGVCTTCSQYQRIDHLPDNLTGNWFDLSGEDYWKLGIQETFLIANSRFWDYQLIQQKDSIYRVNLVSGTQRKQLKVIILDSSTLLINENGGETDTLTNQKQQVERLPLNTPITKTSGPVVISGYIENYQKYKDSSDVVELSFQLFRQHEVPIDSLGRFEFTGEKVFAQDIFLVFNEKWQRLFVEPGDSLMVYFDADNYRPPGQYPAYREVDYMGPHSDVCYDLAYYRDSYREALPSFIEQNSKKYSLEPDEYKQYRKDLLQQEQDYLTKYCLEYGCSEEFKKWYANFTEYSYYRELLRYPMEGINTLEEYNERFYPYEEYHSFLDSIPFDKVDARNNTMFDLLAHAVSNTMLRHAGVWDPKEWKKRRDNVVLDFLRHNEIQSDQDMELINSIHNEKLNIDMLEQHPQSDQINRAIQEDVIGWRIGILKQIGSQAVTDFLMAQRFYLYIVDGKNYQWMDYYLELVEAEIVNPDIRKQVFDDYQALKAKELEIQEIKLPEDIHIYMAEDSGEEFLDMIRQRYLGQVLYVDLWASWCSPCFEDMKMMKPVKQHFKDQEVTFVYLCSRSNRASWMSRIKEFNPTGEHYFLANNLTDDLYKKFDVNGIPRYLLIDRNGVIVDESAPRPRQQEKLIKSIENLL